MPCLCKSGLCFRFLGSMEIDGEFRRWFYKFKRSRRVVLSVNATSNKTTKIALL